MFRHNCTIVVIDIRNCLSILRKRMNKYLPYDVIGIAAEMMLADDLGYIVFTRYLNKRNQVDVHSSEINSIIKELKDNLYADIIEYIPRLSSNDEADVSIDHNYMEIRIVNGSSNSVES